jgi:hypothetical protein
MLLAVVSADMLFTYVNAGAPGNLGDAGLYNASRLWKQVNDRLLRAAKVYIVVENLLHSVYPYFVDNAAFPLTEHILKNDDVKRADVRDDPAKLEFNKRLTNCRILSEMVFGSGVDGQCARGTSHSMVHSCARLLWKHAADRITCLESKRRQMPDGFVEDQDVKFVLPPAGAGAALQQQAGMTKRDLLKQRITEN